MSTSAPVATSYRRLFAVPGYTRIVIAALLGRVATMMQTLVLVLFVLDRFGSPPLAGLTVFFSVAPGLALSPLAGALLDRHRRLQLIRIDYAVAAAAAVLIGALAIMDRLPAAALLVIVAVASLTNPLSNSGTRTLFPIIVPRNLWDRANAMDSSGWVLASIVGPPIGGVVVALLGGPAGLMVSAVFFASACALLVGMREPFVNKPVTGPVMRDAWLGVRYLAGNRNLRGLAVTLCILNIGNGALRVALPVLMLDRLGTGPGSVGLIWALTGVAGLVAGTLFGRTDSSGHEVRLMILGSLLTSVAFLGLVFAGSILLVGLWMLVMGLAEGPYDIGMFALRQRSTDPAWMGRAFTVSMSLNYSGMPIGSGIGGAIAAHSVTAMMLRSSPRAGTAVPGEVSAADALQAAGYQPSSTS